MKANNSHQSLYPFFNHDRPPKDELRRTSDSTQFQSTPIFWVIW